MRVKAIDVHVHHKTSATDTPMAGTDAQKLFRPGRETTDVLSHYKERDLGAVIFDVDKSTTSGITINNEAIADLVRRSEGRFTGFASVDPSRPDALAELERCAAMGLKGLKLQPITQQFHFGDQRFYPLWDFCRQHRWPILVHAGTTGIGAGSPGGRGYKLKYGHPLPDVDDVAADFPELTIIAAHFGWPWHLDLLAIARHKSNVLIDLSGWAPKYVPAEVITYLNKIIPEQFLFGSDYPMITPDRWLREFDALPIDDRVKELVTLHNAERVLEAVR